MFHLCIVLVCQSILDATHLGGRAVRGGQKGDPENAANMPEAHREYTPYSVLEESSNRLLVPCRAEN